MADDLGAYLARIGYGATPVVSKAVLEQLHWRHVSSIPFENLDVLLGRGVDLDPGAIVAKLVTARRGGYCFEHNSLYLAMLRAIGFKASALSARVWWGKKDGQLPQRSHMALRVELDGADYLCDVGFGGLTPVGPLRWVLDVPQQTSHETYRLSQMSDPRVPGEVALQAEIDGGWETLYSFLPLTVDPADLLMANWYVSTHPVSFFTQAMIVVRPFAEGRHVVQDSKFTIRGKDRQETIRQIGDRTDLAGVLAQRFGLELPGADIERLSERLSRLDPGLAK